MNEIFDQGQDSKRSIVIYVAIVFTATIIAITIIGTLAAVAYATATDSERESMNVIAAGTFAASLLPWAFLAFKKRL